MTDNQQLGGTSANQSAVLHYHNWQVKGDVKNQSGTVVSQKEANKNNRGEVGLDQGMRNTDV